LLNNIEETATKKTTFRGKPDHKMSKLGPQAESSQLKDNEERETLKLYELMESLEEKFMLFLDFREFFIN
jgi:hypothetical protein